MDSRGRLSHMRLSQRSQYGLDREMGLWWGDFQNPVVEDSKKAGIEQILKTTSGQMRLNLDGEVAWSSLDHYRCEIAGQGAGPIFPRPSPKICFRALNPGLLGRAG